MTRSPSSLLRTRLFLVLLLSVGSFVGVGALDASARAESAPSLLLATTTSVRDSGLLDDLLPQFTRSSGIDVRVIAVGTGAALRMGREGNADVLLTHAPDAEQVLVDEGIVRRRTPFMQNHFVIAGPAEDPAGVATAATPEAALRSIARTGAAWVSRDDDSGTHKREKSLWKAAGIVPDAEKEEWPGFLRTGTGMGLSLQVAGEKRAYILSDIGTFLAFKDRVGLESLSKPSPALQNTYSILQLDAARFDHPIKTAEADALERFLVSAPVQERIAEFGKDRFGRALFTPLRAPSSSSTKAEAGTSTR